MASIELLNFQAQHAADIVAQALADTLWTPKSKENELKMWALAGLDRPPFGSQVENGILPITKAMETYRYGILNAEMGTGKTQMAFSSAYLYLTSEHRENGKLLFLTAGGKHIPKMSREANEIFGDKCEVFTIVNKAPHEKVSAKKNEVRPEDVQKMVVPEDKIYVYVLSKDTAKMDLSEEVVYAWGDNCPSCHKKILPQNWAARVKKFPKGWQKEAKKYYAKVKGQPYNCPHCEAPLTSEVAKNIWEGEILFKNKKPRSKGSRKLSIGRKFRRLMKKDGRKKIFDMLIVDEVHEMQSGSSLQGRVYRDLVKVSKATMIMTGTLSNGYPSSVFFILQAIMPGHFKELGYNYEDVGKFVDHYGARKFTRSRDVVEKKGSRTSIKVNELPKISDRIISLMAPFTAWLKMEDLNLKMPPYSEEALIVEMEEDVSKRLNNFKSEVLKLLQVHNHKLIKSFAQRFMYLQNNVTYPFEYEFEGEVITRDPEAGVTKIEKKVFKKVFQPFEEDRIFNKERKLVEKIKGELSQGRATLIYSIYNKAAMISNRLENVLSQELDKDVVIRVLPDNVSGEKIEPWVEENPCDVLIASPIKLATGLDLTQFPTIIFYETGTNLRIVQQAARRSWRAVGQDKPVKVIFIAYQGIQANILDIMAKKMRAAAVIEGTKVQAGQIASVFDDDADFTRALNNIANELEQQFKPDFSSSKIEEGKLRPPTVLEIRFEEILKEVKGSGEEEGEGPSENEGNSGSSETEISKEEVEEQLSPIVEEKVATTNSEREFQEEEESIKVIQIESESGAKQLVLDFS